LVVTWEERKASGLRDAEERLGGERVRSFEFGKRQKRAERRPLLGAKSNAVRCASRDA
jgi:hypothetical protein